MYRDQVVAVTEQHGQSLIPNLLFDGLIELVKDIFKNVIALKLILNGNNIAK